VLPLRCFQVSILSMLVFLCGGGACDVASASSTVRFVWKVALGQDNFKYTPNGMTLSPEGTLLVAGTTKPVKDGLGIEESWLWDVNLEGKVIRERKVKIPPGMQESASSVRAIKSFASLEGGDTLVVFESTAGRSFLTKITKEGEQLFTRELAESRYGVEFVKLIPTVDYNILFLGRRLLDALVMKTDATGKVLWEKTFDRNRKDDSFIDGIPTEDGGAVVVGNSGTASQFTTEVSEVWVAKFDTEGNIQAEQMSPGRHGSIARRVGGGCVIAYDTGRSDRQEVWLQALDHNLVPVWQTQLVSIRFGLLGFPLVPVSNNGFVVAAVDNLHLWIARVDTEGKKVWEFRDEREHFTPMVNGLVTTQDALFVLAPVVSQNAQQQLNNKVGIVKFTTK
jgi:hypothetical protein